MWTFFSIIGKIFDSILIIKYILSLINFMNEQEINLICLAVQTAC